MKIKSTRRGFTLIELLVVVLIIGILAALAVPQYQKAVAKSRYASMKHLVKSIADAQEIHFLSTGTYAETYDSLDTNLLENWEWGYINKNRATYTFDWGECVLWTTAFACYVKAGEEEIWYKMNYIHTSDRKAGITQCLAWSDNINSTGNQICKQETGQTSPFHEPKGYKEWNYPN